MARNPNTNSRGEPFDEATIKTVWEKGIIEPAFPGFRKDVCGASMLRSRHGKTVQWGWEIDHIKPVARGGGDELDNLQPLRWENNRHKGDSHPSWECKIKD